MSSSTKKIWFITGSSSGFGRSMVEHVLQSGDIAVATLRNPVVLDSLAKQYPSSQLLVLKLDVSQPDDITAAFDATRVAFGRIDVVFNNAAYGLLAEAEAAPDAAARKMFEVNFWGAANVSRAAVAFFRDVNSPQGGRLLQISSAAGYVGCAGVAYYSATKFALEGFSEALAAELDPEWNIKVTVVEPGAFRTDTISRSLQIAAPHPAYTKPTLQSVVMRNVLTSGVPSAGDANKAAALFRKLAAIADPPLHLPLGKDALDMARKKVDAFRSDIEQSAPWSDGINHDDP